MRHDKFPLIPEQPAAPHLVTPLPGPKAKALVDRDQVVTSPSYTRDYPLVMESGIGSVVVDPDGNRFLDMAAGIAVNATGHSHPYVVEAIIEQTRRFIHMSGTDFFYRPQIELAERLAKLAPMSGRNRVFFTNSGAEALEAAFKLSRYHTQRQNVIAFWGAFHGRTYGAMSLTGSKAIQQKRFGPMVPGVQHVTYPNPYRPAGNVGVDKIVDFTFDEIERIFKRKVDPSGVAAIFVEPIQGEGGYIVPPSDFFPRLRELCDQHGILLVCDEVQSGFGRTGRMWAVQHYGVEPDIITSAKGIASGMPLGAMIARESVMDWPYGAHASTFGGNPVACAASLATIDLLEAGLIDNAAKVGAHLQSKLREMQKSMPCIGDVRGKGLMVVAEFIKPDGGKTPDPELRNKTVMAAFNRGLLVLGCGESGIRFSPALTVSEAQIDTAVKLLGEAIAGAAL